MKISQIIAIIFLLAIVGTFISLAKFNAGSIDLHIHDTYFIISYQQFFSVTFGVAALIIILSFVFRSARKKKNI